MRGASRHAAKGTARGWGFFATESEGQTATPQRARGKTWFGPHEQLPTYRSCGLPRKLDLVTEQSSSSFPKMQPHHGRTLGFAWCITRSTHARWAALSTEQGFERMLANYPHRLGFDPGQALENRNTAADPRSARPRAAANPSLITLPVHKQLLYIRISRPYTA